MRNLFTQKFGLVAIIATTLGLSLGTNFALFAVLDSIVLQTLPFLQSERLVTIFNSYPQGGSPRAGASIANYFDRRGKIPALSSLAIYRDTSVIVGTKSSALRTPIMRVSYEFFSTLGVAPRIGRQFTEKEMSFGTDGVAILTDSYWKTEFGSDPNVVGKIFRNDEESILIIGVLPPSFQFLSSQAKFFRPFPVRPGQRMPFMRHNYSAEMIGRMVDGTNVQEVQTQIDAFNRVQSADDPIAAVVKEAGYHTAIAPLKADYIRTARGPVVYLQLGGILLLLACVANAGNLLVLRALGRRYEMSVKSALGAHWSRIFRESFAESCVLISIGGIFGVIFGMLGIEFFRVLGSDKLPLGSSISFHFGYLGIVVISFIAISLLLGFPVAIWQAKRATEVRLETGTQDLKAGKSSRRLRYALMVLQVAFSFILLAGAMVLSLGLYRALDSSLGFNPSHVIAGRIELPAARFPEGDTQTGYLRRLEAAMSSISIIDDSSLSTSLPFTSGIPRGAVATESSRETKKTSPNLHHIYNTGAHYFHTMAITLRQGRLYSDNDRQDSPHECVVDQGFADVTWPKRDAIGKRICIGTDFDNDSAFTVVGVVATSKHERETDSPNQGTVYLPIYRFPSSSFWLVAHTTADPKLLFPIIQKAVSDVDSQIPIAELRPLTERIDDSLILRRAPAILAAAFSAISLLVMAVGLYGVVSYCVVHERQDIAIKLALGATSTNIRNHYIGIGMKSVIVGSGIGLVLSWWALKAISAIFIETGQVHLGSFVIVIITVASVALPAALIPAVRASRIDPLSIMRSQ